VSPAAPFVVRLRFHRDLDYFLRNATNDGEICRQLGEPTSIKDVIESCGVPHPEVDRIVVAGTAIDFSYVLRESADVEVYPVGFGDKILPGNPLQQSRATRFLADGHLGKLVRNLRLLGIDTMYDAQLDDMQLLELMQADQRALLTRDRRLLMHRVVVDGYCPRSSDPMEQTVEVVRRFNLRHALQPFTRCLHCNGLLAPVEKSDVLDQLEPLTRVYYHEFRKCTGCGRIFWRGSHFAKLEEFLERLHAAIGDASS
jgi:uncharacterized protein with PIN domain